MVGLDYLAKSESFSVNFFNGLDFLTGKTLILKKGIMSLTVIYRQ